MILSGNIEHLKKWLCPCPQRAFGAWHQNGPLFLCDLKCDPRTLWLLEFSESKENKVDEGNILFSSLMGDFIAFVFLKKRQVLAWTCIFCTLGLDWHIPSCYCQSDKYIFRQFMKYFSFLKKQEVILVCQMTYKMAFESCVISSLWLLLSCALRKEKEGRLKYWLVFCDWGFFLRTLQLLVAYWKVYQNLFTFHRFQLNKSLVFLK